MIPYGRQSVGEEEAAEILKVLRSDFLTQGPAVERFEQAVAAYCGVRFAVALSSGTAALHAAYAAFGIGPGDELITSPITFVATASAALYVGGRPVFADVDPATGLVSPCSVSRRIGPRTKAIVPVDFAGRPADYDSLRPLADSLGIPLIADAAHSLGGAYGGRRVGQLADATVFSFHPVKTITTGEGGMVVTDRGDVADSVRRFRHHGIARRPEIAREQGEWYYEVRSLGSNYRISDLHAAIGLAQMGKIERFLARRCEIARRYDEAFAGSPFLEAPVPEEGLRSARHLYCLRVKEELPGGRRVLFESLRRRGIGAQVHYIPVYRHPYFRDLGYPQREHPGAETFYAGTISLPVFPSMTDGQIEEVIRAVKESVELQVGTPAEKAETCQSRITTPG